MINYFKKFVNNNTGILIRLDDIAENMNWELMAKCEELFDKYNVKPVLGVIPNNKDNELMTYERKENFGTLFEIGIKKDGKYPCMETIMFMTNKLIKKIF